MGRNNQIDIHTPLLVDWEAQQWLVSGLCCWGEVVMRETKRTVKQQEEEQFMYS